MPGTAGQPVVVRSGAGELLDVGGIRHLFALTAGHTEGRLGLEEFVLPPGTLGARPHVHGAHDEYFVVLSGELTLSTAGDDVVLGPGDVAAALRGTAHGYRNDSGTEPARALCLYTPAGYEQYFRDVHAAVASGAEPTDDLLALLRSRYDTTTS